MTTTGKRIDQYDAVTSLVSTDLFVIERDPDLAGRAYKNITVANSGIAVGSDVAYDATTWNGNLEVPTKNVVRDIIESLLLSGAGSGLVYKGLLTLTDGMDFPAATLGDWYIAYGTSYWIGGTASTGIYINAGDILLCTTTATAGTYAQKGAYWWIKPMVISMPDGYRQIWLSDNTALVSVAGDYAIAFEAGVLKKVENGVEYPIHSNTYDTIYIPASAMTPTATSGAAAGSYEYATNKLNKEYLAFDGTAEEFADYSFPMPEGWDRGTFKAKFKWSSATGSTAGDTVEWKICAVALSDNDTIDAALGTAQVITDTLLASSGTKKQTSAVTPAITCGGTPALGDDIHIKVSRNSATGTDDMAEDAWLFGVWLQIKLTNAVAAW